MRMRIFADKRYLPERLPHCQMLYPFWGFASKLVELPWLSFRVFDGYMEGGGSIFAISPLEDAEVAVLPFQWEQIVPQNLVTRLDAALYGEEAEVIRRTVADALRRAEELAAAAAGAGKPLAVFFVDDSETMYFVDEGEAVAASLRDAYTFRPSLSAARRAPRDFALPVWLSEDEVGTSFGGRPPLRCKAARPVVSFCGVPGPRPACIRSKLRRRLAASATARRAAARLGLEVEPRHHSRARAQALDILSRSRDVQTGFIMRDGWFNRVFEGQRVNVPLLRQSRAEYYENILASDYVLCARGVGNYSFRFYEALSCGRVPVFVNTDCVLPFERWIDWKRYCVWVEEEELPQIAEKVAEFHERLSPAEFQDLQMACRRLWEEWLSPLGFFKNFHRHFR